MIEKRFCVAIWFYEGVYLLPHGQNRPISALCVAIKFVVPVSLLPHRPALGMFCNPVGVAILKE
jgi:hypothetical protein